ncbi:MAG: biopolymer transport protein ExbD, partial [Arenicella sp.]
MNFGHSDEQDETSIELTPLIDVVFLLLIFFMI